MSTDRKLLELAAKAAGLEYRWDGAVGMMRARLPGSGAAFPGWNPLTDDGDALRLAVKLRLCVMHEFDRVDVSISIADEVSVATEYLYELPSPTDPNAATRRAIVRAAAAQIGKTNQPGEADA